MDGWKIAFRVQLICPSWHLKAFPCCCHRRCPLRLSYVASREVHFEKKEDKNKGERDIATFELGCVVFGSLFLIWLCDGEEEEPPLSFSVIRTCQQSPSGEPRKIRRNLYSSTTPSYTCVFFFFPSSSSKMKEQFSFKCILFTAQKNSLYFLFFFLSSWHIRWSLAGWDSFFSFLLFPLSLLFWLSRPHAKWLTTARERDKPNQIHNTHLAKSHG